MRRVWKSEPVESEGSRVDDRTPVVVSAAVPFAIAAVIVFLLMPSSLPGGYASLSVPGLVGPLVLGAIGVLLSACITYVLAGLTPSSTTVRALVSGGVSALSLGPAWVSMGVGISDSDPTLGVATGSPAFVVVVAVGLLSLLLALVIGIALRVRSPAT